MQISQSKKLFSLAQQKLPGGVNSPVRAFKSVNMTPLFIASGQGSKLFDKDGNEYIDYVGSWGPMILGHANPKIVSKLKEPQTIEHAKFILENSKKITVREKSAKKLLIISQLLNLYHQIQQYM